MTDSTSRFSDRVENYIKYRPDYPAEVLKLLHDKCELNENSLVADVGSGTGIFARLLLATGCRVFGVEPNAPMREAAENLLASELNFASVAGTAEATTLPAHSVHLVTCAQAFHWFDREKCKIEFARILCPGGSVALVWNERLVNSTPFLRDYEQLLLDFATDYQQVNHTQIDDAVLRDFFAPHVFQKYTFPNRQIFDYNGLQGRLLSSSYAPPAGHPAHELMLAKLCDIFRAFQQNGTVSFDYETNIYIGKLLPATRDLNLAP